MRVHSPSVVRALLALALTAGLACSSGGDGGTNPTGSFTISVSPGAVSVEQGGTGQATVTLTRVDGFAGTVAFTVEGAPSGVSASVSGGGSGAVSTGTVTITVGAGVATGTYNLTLRAAASGQSDRTAPFALTVTPSGGFSIATTLPGLTVTQGGTGTGTATLTRTGSFSGAVSLSVSGVPTGVTAVFDPATIAAGSTSADLDFTASGAVATGVYPLVITATSAGLPNATTNFTLTIVQNPGAGSFTLAINPSPIEIQQGASGQATITVTRTGGFTGAVTLALTTTSANISATFQPAVIPAGSTTSLVTINVPAIAGAPNGGPGGPSPTPLGDYPLVFTGTAPGVSSATVNLTVSVSPAPGGSFSMVLAPPSATAQVGGNVQSTLTVTRVAPFVGGVGLSISGLPPGVQASFSPVAITAGGTTAQLTLFTNEFAAAGTYPLVVTGVGDGVNVPNATANFTLTLTAAPGGGPIAFQFCDPAFAPLWFAYQDQAGIGPWIPVTAGAGTTYSFDLAANSGGVAWVEPDGSGGFTTKVTYSSRGGITQLGQENCGRTSGTTVTGSVTGLGVTDQALISLGTSGSAANFGVPNFTIRRVPPGSRSLIATRSSINLPSVVYTTNKVIIRRNQTLANGAVIPVLNFDTEGFTPIQRNLTVNNLMGWVNVSNTQYFTDQGGSSGSLVASGSGSAFPSIPAGQQVAGDFHYVAATAFPDLFTTTQSRSAGRFFVTGADQTVTLGPLLSAPTITALPGSGYARLQVGGTIQAEYNRFLTLSYSQTGRSAMLMMTGSPFTTGGGATYSMAFPNFSGLAGWLDAWMPSAGAQTNWSLFAQGWDGGTLTGGEVVEGERVFSALTSGAITP